MINILKLRKLEKEKSAGTRQEITAEAPAKEINQAVVEIQETSETVSGMDAAEETIIQEVPSDSFNSGLEVSDDKTVTDTSAPEELSYKEPSDPSVETENVEEAGSVMSEEPEEEVNLQAEKAATEDDPAELLRQQLLKELLAQMESEEPEVPTAEDIADDPSLYGLAPEVKTIETKAEEPASGEKLPEFPASESAAENTGNESTITESQPAESPIAAIKKLPYKEPEVIPIPPPENKAVPVKEAPQAKELTGIDKAIAESNSARHEEAKGKKNIEEVVQLVGFMLGRECYGVDINCIKEINRMVDITRVPRAPEFIEGVINLRGSVIPVINLRAKVKMPRKEYDKDTRIIIVELKGMVIGFIVDSVREVLRIPQSVLAPPPTLAVGRNSDYITAVAKLEDRLVILMDPEKVLSAEDNKKLDEMKKK